MSVMTTIDTGPARRTAIERPAAAPASTCPFHHDPGAARADDDVPPDEGRAATGNGAAAVAPLPPDTLPPDTLAPSTLPPGTWPPGPPAGLTGWGLLAEMARDMLAALARWQRDYGDVIHLRIWPEHQIVVTDPTLVRELLVNHHDDLVRWRRATRVFEAAHGRSVLVVEGQAWKDKRRALQPAFAPQPVQTLVPTIADAAARRLARWPDQAERWPIEYALNAVTMDVILRMMFSTSMGEEADAFSQAIRDVGEAANAEFYWPASLPDWVPWKRRKRRGIALMNRLIVEQVDRRLDQDRSRWPDDLLTRLLALHATDPARWPLDAVRDECRTAFLAGHDTTAGALTWWAWLMASHPEAQARATAEVRDRLGNRAPTPDDLRHLPWLGQTLQETLRLYPSAPVLFTRRALRPITLGRWQFPARTMFLLPLQRIQHDPRWFDDPLAFRPERFAREGSGPRETPRGTWLPFGAGPRVCLGQHLAMTEMTLVAAMVLQRFTLSVPPDQPPPLPRLQVTLKPVTPLTLSINRGQSRFS